MVIAQERLSGSCTRSMRMIGAGGNNSKGIIKGVLNLIFIIWYLLFGIEIGRSRGSEKVFLA